MKKAMIAMSGGVDSSVAAYFMREQGFDCIGVTMKLFRNEDIDLPREHSCCSLDDVEDARDVARTLGIPHYVFNFSSRFREDVIDRFISAYESGRTPNPCIDCNRYLKFDKLFLRAKELSCETVATGHYARIEFNKAANRYYLKKAIDSNKDQSYFLYTMTQEQLAMAAFPLGGMTKPEVRAIADANGFVNARKHDSQDICFVQNGSYADFIESYTGKTYPPGDFIDPSGKVLGKHQGIIRYTIGQRRGLGIALGKPAYVSAVDPIQNTVTLSTDKSLYARSLTAHQLNFIAVENIYSPMRVKAKLRYRHKEQWAEILQTGEDEITVNFEEPQRAATSGQAVVFYDGELVIGGGTID